MATIKDLAKYCNVSISTVSYALNDSDEISVETKERIKKAAKELNYVPNAYARGLKRRRTYNIGVVISGFEGPIHHNVLAGIASE
jgi:LacI family transcriptional regulator